MRIVKNVTASLYVPTFNFHQVKTWPADVPFKTLAFTNFVLYSLELWHDLLSGPFIRLIQEHHNSQDAQKTKNYEINKKKIYKYLPLRADEPVWRNKRQTSSRQLPVDT